MPSAENSPFSSVGKAPIPDLLSPTDGSEITSFNAAISQSITDADSLKSPDENHFANTPPSVNASPTNVFRSDDCNELLAKELAKLDGNNSSDQDDGMYIFCVSYFFVYVYDSSI